MNKLLKTIIALLLFATLTGYSQSLEKQFDGLLKQEYPENGTGVSALVAIDGEIVYHKSFGKANLEWNVDVDNTTKFEIGSITKQFTAVAILMLAEQGKLNIDDNITEYFEDYPTHGHTIKISHLLSHTSGLASFTAYDDWYDNRYNDISQEEFMAMFKKTPMLFAPGEKYYYSNTGYFLLGMLVEKLSGQTYAEFIDQHIFKKLGMKNSTFLSRHEIITNRATGHVKVDDKLIKSDEFLYGHAFSAGAIISTTYDLFLWNRAIKNNVLISEASKRNAFANTGLSNGKYANYGYGWAINEVNEVPSIEHNGGTFGFFSNAIYLPNPDIFVVALSNCVCSATDFVSTKMAAIAANRPYIELSDKDVEINAEFADKIVGTYEFEDGSKRIISFENNTLYSQVPNNGKSKLYPIGPQTFQIKDSFAQFIFNHDQKGSPSLLFKNRIRKTRGTKTAN
jgi:CubicO group peptidase (beta-lactamase class C family)